MLYWAMHCEYRFESVDRESDSETDADRKTLEIFKRAGTDILYLILQLSCSLF